MIISTHRRSEEEEEEEGEEEEEIEKKNNLNCRCSSRSNEYLRQLNIIARVTAITLVKNANFSRRGGEGGVRGGGGGKHCVIDS